MFNFLAKLLKRDSTIPAEPIDTNVPEDGTWEILHPNDEAMLSLRKKSLQAFIQFATRQLNKAESQRLCLVAKRALDDYEGTFEALSEVICGEEGQQRGKWVFIQLDWKSREEIVWQVSEILSTFGISEHWECDCEVEFDSVHEALLALSNWLVARNLALLHIETNADSYCSLIVRVSDVPTAQELALAAQLTLYDHVQFSHQNS
ncbi:hypothetical protein JQR88_25230 (plasmid) [Pseudomonas luteola]|uniref:DUF6630 family protein n=1 Tax=Pseudomonas luteola TaxID=47886 RepID=UPI003DA109D3